MRLPTWAFVELWEVAQTRCERGPEPVEKPPKRGEGDRANELPAGPFLEDLNLGRDRHSSGREHLIA